MPNSYSPTAFKCIVTNTGIFILDYLNAEENNNLPLTLAQLTTNNIQTLLSQSQWTTALNSNKLENATWEIPGTIGSSTPNSGVFTTLNASGGITGNLTGDVTGNLSGVASNSNALESKTWEAPGTIGITTPNSGAFTTLSATGGITGNLTGNVTGTASNASALENATWEAPGTIGGTTPNSGAFTTLSATGGITGNLTGNVTGNATTATTATNANALENATWEAPGTIGSTTPNSGAFTTLSANNYSELVNNAGNSGTSITIDLHKGNTQEIILTGNATLTVINMAASGYKSDLTLILTQDTTGSRLVTWPITTKWAGGSVPVLSTAANAMDIIKLITVDGGATWYGSVIGIGMA